MNQAKRRKRHRDWVQLVNIQKAKIMAPGPITSWQIDGGKVKTMANFIFLGSKITVDGDGSHKIERHLLLVRKIMTNLDSILKSRDTTLMAESEKELNSFLMK